MSDFEGVLSIDLQCRMLRVGSAVILVLGDAGEAWVASQTGCDITPWISVRVLFGLAIYTASWPILLKQVVAERGLTLQSLSLFGWIEDNFMTEPRAEVKGITPFGEEPLLFIRDLDLDLPPQCCVINLHGAQPEMLLLAGVLWVDASAEERLVLEHDEAAVFGLELSLPAAAKPFAEMLRAECAGGRNLRSALKAFRQQMSPMLMTHADGWRVLTRAVPMVRLGVRDTAVSDSFELRQLTSPAPKKMTTRN